MSTEERNVIFICPTCKGKGQLSLPERIINQSKHLTTVSLPSGIICEHNFQAFIDKNFKVRGYQTVDFQFSSIEYYEERKDEPKQDSDLEKGDLSQLSSPLFYEIITVLRDFLDQHVRHKDILGTALLEENGKVLYSSLPHDILFSTIREFEVRKKKNLILVSKLILVLENDQKVFSEIIKLDHVRFVVVLIFSKAVKLGLGNMYLTDISKQIEKLK